jgi:PKD repeat protein
MKQTSLKLIAFLSLTTLLFATSCSVNEIEEPGEVKSISQVTDLEAAFDVDAKPTALKARFYNKSVSADYYRWSFPGGTPSSSQAENSPIIEYPESGEYTVTLKVVNGSQSDTYTTTIQL